MSTNPPTPAAQYLRISTEHQQYSLEVQAAAIREYAEKNHFTIVKTYTDDRKSGLQLKHRQGLKDLLQDVGAGATHKVILVYDVSRWGRFQDSDESAHYEFLCRHAGTPVHYCAQAFLNDGTMAAALMKALKRIMAAEYGRELSEKATQSLIRLV